MAQRRTTGNSRDGAGRSSGRSSASRSSSSGRSGTGRSTSTRSTSRNASGTGRSGNRGNSGENRGNGGGMMNLLKAFLFVIAIAVVFGAISWGLEKLGERGEKGNKTVTPTATVNTPGATGDPNNPTDTPTPTPETTAQDVARKTMQKVSGSTLKLKKEFSEYRVEIDDYTSNIHGTECVGVNVLEPDSGQLVGIYYVAVDGSVIYREREDGEFDTITP